MLVAMTDHSISPTRFHKLPVTVAKMLAILFAALLLSSEARADNVPRNIQRFDDSFKATFGGFNLGITDEGRDVTLILNQKSGSGFRSNDSYLYGSFGARMKLVPANAAGIVVSFYLSSDTKNHDEIDFEFLGNKSGEPWILQTNVFANGAGGREERTYLWFNPSEEHHSYRVIWNQQQIVFFVDNIPIRVFKNNEKLGVSYPSFQPMGLYSSIFEASTWATRNGLDKIDWSGAPFVASYQKFEISACKVDVDAGGSVDGCLSGEHLKWWESKEFQGLTWHQKAQLGVVRKKFMVYDYCTDVNRYLDSLSRGSALWISIFDLHAGF